MSKSPSTSKPPAAIGETRTHWVLTLKNGDWTHSVRYLSLDDARAAASTGNFAINYDVLRIDVTIDRRITATVAYKEEGGDPA